MEVPAQFILNLFIAFLWMTFQDEDELRLSTFFVGFIVGIVIILLMHRFFGTRFYLHRFYSVIKLILIFISELFQSGFLVMKTILSRDIDLEPGIFRYETELSAEWEAPTLALLLTLSPGSVVMEVTPEGNVFHIHAMDIEKYKGNLIS